MLESTQRATKYEFSFDGKTRDYYWVVGDKENPPLLLIPGFTGTHTDLLLLASLLKEQYFVIVPDLPGWGKSPRFPELLTIHNYAKYILHLLQQLQIDSLTLCGHCMGATLAIEIATIDPSMVEEVILISTPYLKGTMSQKMFVVLANMSDHAPKTLRRIFFLWRNRIIGIPLDIYLIKVKSLRKKLHFILRRLMTQQQQHEDAVEEAWSSLVHYDYAKVKNITSKVHLIQGSDDPLVSLKQTAKFHSLIPTATLDIIPHSGHMPPVETPQSLAHIILKYK